MCPHIVFPVLPNLHHSMNILKIGSVNIQGGITRKLQEDDVIDLVKKFDICCLQESWLTSGNSLSIDDYIIHRSDRKKGKKLNVGSGGVVTLLRSRLSKGIAKLSSKCNDLMWSKLDKHFLTWTMIYSYATVIFHPKTPKF